MSDEADVLNGAADLIERDGWTQGFLMHDHATDGGRRAFEDKSSARDLRLHLDNAHDERTSGLSSFYGMAAQHHELHAVHDAKAARLAEIEAAADLISDRLAEAPPAVVEGIVGDRSIYLEGANGTLYLAEPVDPRHMPAPGPLYRLTEQVPSGGVDILAATKASLAATRAYLDAHKTSGGPTPPDAPGEGAGSAGRRHSPGPLSSTAASNLLRDGEAPGAAVDAPVGGGEPAPPRPASRPAPSGSARSGGAS